jgi:hypothetical protein
MKSRSNKIKIYLAIHEKKSFSSTNQQTNPKLLIAPSDDKFIDFAPKILVLSLIAEFVRSISRFDIS